MSRSNAIIQIVIACALWGFGFTATVWALDSMGPLGITGWRFVLASLTGFSFAFLNPKLRPHINMKTIRAGMIPGLLLSLTLVLQTWGLKTTTATKSGFITCLYVLLVPVLERHYLNQKLHRLHYLFVIIALGGTALICGFNPFAYNLASSSANIFANSIPSAQSSHWSTGDFLTLLCAVAASFHIISLAYQAPKAASPFVFNLSQSLWAGILPLILSFIFEGQLIWPLVGKPLYGMLFLALGSTLVAFSLQVRAQKKLSPSTASLLFLLESPFATLYAIYFLGENLNISQWFGAGLILIAAAISSFATVEAIEAPSISRV
jgi:drug/metabolite transporter (DMT)-like permease